MNPFGCFGDAAGSAVRLGTLWQILLDGANGVTQAPRLCATLEPSALGAALVTLAAVAAAATFGRRRTAVTTVMVALLALSYVPGWIHLLRLRADRPAVQRALSREVTATRASYVSAMKVALAATPATTCFAPSFVGTCIDPSGIYLGAARDLWPRWQCLGGETARVTIEVSGCSAVGVEARALP